MKRLILALALPACLWFTGCGAKAQGSVPNKAELTRRAANPSYATPKGTRQEALGRLVFNAPYEVEWGIHPMNIQEKRYGFPGEAFLEYGTVEIEGMEIHVMDSAPRSEVLKCVNTDDSRKENQIRSLSNKIETITSILSDLKQPDYKDEDTEGFKRTIESYESDIKTYQSYIESLRTNHHPFDLGLPYSTGYQSGGALHGYLWREGRLYCFDKDFDQGDRIPTAKEKQAFVQFIKNFRVRKLFEIPEEPGICLPYGFVPDDGKSQYILGVSFRFKDRPNVLWSINTGTMESQPNDFGIDGEAIENIYAMEMLRKQPGRNVRVVEKEPIQIGALPAWQKGAVVTHRPYRNLPFLETYEFLAFRHGLEGSQMLPYLGIRMRGINQEFDKTLKTQPPPFKESKTRHDALLKSIRIRPTNPPMPELAALQNYSTP